MLPFERMDAVTASKIRYVLCDIDDTITTCGKLTARAYAALWELHDAGVRVVPVTGRPAGWCDMIAREWPVRAVVGENGAFVFYAEGERVRAFTHPSIPEGDARARLDAVRDACLARVPGCRVARDQFARVYDLAIDFDEDPPRLGLEAAKRIKAVCEEFGATAKISSIHVNAWFGDYDKLNMARLFLGEVLGEGNIRESVLFFGDSPNDEPMFGFFPQSCAVANIAPFLGSLKSLPGYLAKGESGEGFTEAVRHFLGLRSGSR